MILTQRISSLVIEHFDNIAPKNSDTPSIIATFDAVSGWTPTRSKATKFNAFMLRKKGITHVKVQSGNVKADFSVEDLIAA